MNILSAGRFELYNRTFYNTDMPVRSDNTIFKIENLNIITDIHYNSISKLHFPKFINIELSFNYVNKKTREIQKINIYSQQLFYDLNSYFSEPLPNEILSSMNDYDMMSIAVVNNDLWKNETSIVKTDKEKQLTKYMSIYSFYNTKLSIWKKQWKLDWKKTFIIEPAQSGLFKKKAKLVNVDAFIYLDYYRLNEKYVINTRAIFNYNGCYLPIKQRTVEMKRLIEEYFENVHLIADELKNLLNNNSNVNPKIINTEYNKANRKLRKTKKEFMKKQKAYLRNWLFENEYGAKITR